MAGCRGSLFRVSRAGRWGGPSASHLWGRGYATEIGRAALQVAFDQLRLDTVVAFTEIHNENSLRVMRRLEMTYVHEIRRPGLVAGSPVVGEDVPFALYKINKRE